MNNESSYKGNNSKHHLIKEYGFTYDDYASINDDNRYELARGQLEMMSPAPSIIHQIVSTQILKQLIRSCESQYILLPAPVDVILSTTEVRQPDLVLVHRERINILSKRGVEGAPDLVVEVLSPSTLKRDKMDKSKTYADFKIPEYWIVDPYSGIMEQYTIREDYYELFNIFQEDEPVTSPNLSCVSFTMAAIMDNVPDIKNN